MTSPVPGWYADPAGGGDERWWDGSRWTGNVRPAPAPAPTVPPAGYGQAPSGQYGQTPTGQYGQAPTGQYGQAPTGQYGQAPTGQYGQAPTGQYGQAPSGQYGQAPTGQYGGGDAGAPGTGFGGYGQPQPAAPRTFVQRNGYSLAAIGVGVLYALIALEFRFVLIGFLPLLFGFRALRRREPLGVLGIVVGVLALLFAIYALGHGL